MYTREEASQIRREFWTTLGNYLAPYKSAEGAKVNWLNYKTGLKNVYFRMDADKRSASISIEITHPDLGIQELFFEQFLELKNILQGYMDEEWEWILHTSDENGKTISTISKKIFEVNIFRKEDWHKLISFLKPRMLALDEFWSDAKYSFESLK
ncbi:DUF4268 domain-containing protein [Pedobacter sp. SYSU D00535]|uniref:DUF4268 domain-containing protein n=1 Tax=Pedobacter sp. SYSU D00535 TaxID=2810308 RepID=UPI001A964175|nr:DUF4268 domain-containing protein [Pedobacter sp. SYSU D00535]